LNWRLNYKGKALVISSGLVYLNSKHPKGLYIDEIIDMIEKEPNKNYYSKETIKNVLLSRVENNEEIGKERSYYSSINLWDLQPERDFDKLPTTGKELLRNRYNSKARRVNEHQ